MPKQDDDLSCVLAALARIESRLAVVEAMVGSLIEVQDAMDAERGEDGRLLPSPPVRIATPPDLAAIFNVPKPRRGR